MAIDLQTIGLQSGNFQSYLSRLSTTATKAGLSPEELVQSVLDGGTDDDAGLETSFLDLLRASAPAFDALDAQGIVQTQADTSGAESGTQQNASGKASDIISAFYKLSSENALYTTMQERLFQMLNNDTKQTDYIADPDVPSQLELLARLSAL